MKKNLIFLLTLLVGASLFSGCKKDQVSENFENSFPDQTLSQNSLIDPATPSLAAPLISSNLKSTPSGDWELMFSDEFADTVTDTAKWNNIYKDRGWKDGIQTFWRPENMVENGTSLSVKFKKDWNNAYSSGNYNTSGKFEMAYGYWECRMHVVFPDGYQSAFWMMPSDGTLPGGLADDTANDGAEIDIVEANSQSNEFATNLHWDGYGAYHHSSHVDVAAPGLHNNWMNVFGLEWTPEYLKFYYNGNVVRTVTNSSHISQIKEHAILSGGVFAGDWVDGDILTASLPDWGYIDYIRVYKNKQMDYGDGYFKVINKLSGKCLSVEDWLTSAGAKVVQTPDNEFNNQKFNLEHLGSGLYKVIAKHSGKYIGVNAAGYLSQQNYSDSNSQKWRIEPIPGTNLSSLQNYADEMYAEVENGSSDNDARIMVEDHPSWNRAKWEIVWVE